ncbi:hypothetical protein [Xanthomonas campestris]|uniref:hypothetical protein n=1 Tax=Xanthomonas campestris TaxID=339 RepID=UPI000E0E9A61|nr:hypothetical protein [Xanthomonas campestris]MDM7753915.1 hypothetical protein [Xanthomonas campestris pv. campestris]MDM7762306.1 hypothetical protein [Xanthomonas campestris pv. campestris]MEB1955752.1 hypothetical protein [Xanthomonas campestris pv. campestris]
MNYSQYLGRVVQLVSLNQKNGQPMTAAVLGSYLSSSVPEVSFKSFGKRHLREVLADLETAKYVTLTTTDKGALAVQLSDSAPATVAPEGAAQIDRITPLKKAVWEAFLFSAPAGLRFANRISGVIQIGLTQSPTPEEDWIEITPVTNDTQHAWVLDFLGEHTNELTAEVQEALNSSHWSPPIFGQMLRKLDPGLAKRWNCYRSKMAIAYVRNWLAQAGLPDSWAFERIARPTEAIKTAGEAIQITDISTTPATSRGEDADARETILAALAQLPLSKLLELPIPAGVLLHAIASRSSR